MLNLLQNNSANIFGKSWVICLFVACSYTLMEATVLSCPFSWVWSCMPKVLWNNQSPISVERVEWLSWFFSMQLFSSCWIFIEATKLCYFGMALSCIGSHIVRYFKLKKLGNYVSYQVDFLLPLKLQKTLCYFGLWPQKAKNSWLIFLQDFLLLTCLTC